MIKKQIVIGKEIFSYLDEGTSKEVLVLIHGNMSSSLHFLPLVERLKDQYRIIAPDMRGFGDSSYVESFDSLHDLADDTISLLKELNITTYNLAAWSTGGGVAMSIAQKEPKQVENLILIESCSYRGYPIFKKDAAGQPILGEYYTSKEELALDPVQVKPMIDIFNNNQTPYMKAVWDSAIYTVNKPTPEEDALYLQETMKQRNLKDIDWALTTFNMSNFSNGVTLGDDTIQEITCPTLTLYGDKDIIILEYMIDETVEAIKNIKKVLLKDSGHSPLVDCPDQLAKEITEFIKTTN